ncbi:MAG TPA: ferric iron reductase [Pyrinomonadaceae bacterium]
MSVPPRSSDSKNWKNNLKTDRHIPPPSDPTHYLLSPSSGQAALNRLSRHYEDAVRWVYQEQKLNDRAVREGDYPIHPKSVPLKFWPEAQPVFWLPEFEAPHDHFRVFQSTSRSLPWYFRGTDGKSYSQLVHPLTVKYFVSRKIDSVSWKKPRFLATPMSSHRTLLVWGPRSTKPPFVIKSSVDVWIGGLNRNVRLKEIKRSVGISSLFAELTTAELNRHGILLLDDSVGLVHKGTNAGLLARDASAKLGRGEEIIPIFSLVASREGRPPRIVEMIKRSRLGPTAWVDKYIFRPLIYQAYFLGMTTGLVGEMHEQNILMELCDGLPTKRFWHRDLGGFGVDRDLRRLANKDFTSLPKGIHERHLGATYPLLHLLLRMYLQGSLGWAIGYALHRHLNLPLDDFVKLYNLRASELQCLIFSTNGANATTKFEKDLERYRKHNKPIGNWRWRSMDEALREWRRIARPETS